MAKTVIIPFVALPIDRQKLGSGNSSRFDSLNCGAPVRSNHFELKTTASAMKATLIPAIHFPTAREKGPFPFPTSQAMSIAGRNAAQSHLDEPLPGAEELRLMADTMPGDGPGD